MYEPVREHATHIPVKQKAHKRDILFSSIAQKIETHTHHLTFVSLNITTSTRTCLILKDLKIMGCHDSSDAEVN
jgi:hypothetical protein